MCRPTGENCNFYVFYKKRFNDGSKKQAFGFDETLTSRNVSEDDEKPTSTPSIKQRYETQFRIKRNENERMQPSELIVFSIKTAVRTKRRKNMKIPTTAPACIFSMQMSIC